ncbi:MAG: hypothetical protein IJG87_02005 [Ruminococcus sp.]|nr:hypothetical protein [Ruminococcus sp.]
MFKKGVSLLLALVMISATFAVLPVSAAQADEEIVDEYAAVGIVPESGGDNETEIMTNPTVNDQAEETAAETERGGQLHMNGGYLSYSIDLEAGTVMITRGDSLTGDPVIPSEIEGYPVTAIDDYALLKQEVTSVTVPDSVKDIGIKAIGYFDRDDDRSNSDIAIKGSELSAAEYYAEENGFRFVDVNADKYPHITSFENTEKGAKIKWSAFNGTDYYRVYCKNTNGEWNRLTSTSKREYVDTSVKGGETRVYTVRALNSKDDFVSDYSRKGWSNLFIEAPTVSLNNDEDGVMIKWNACKGAERYRIYYYGKDGWKKMAETTKASFLDTDVRSGNSYTYTVRCISADSRDFTSDYKAGKKIRYVAAPRITSFENTEKGAKFKWNACKGADFYRIYYKNKDGGWTRLASKYLTEYTDTSVKPGEKRVYTIRCLNEKEDFVSDYVGKGFENTYIEAPTVSLSNHEDGVKIAWNACKGAERYRIYYYGKDGWKKMAETTKSSFVDTDVRSGNSYTYTVRCISADGKDFTSDYKAGRKIRYVAAPRITSFENLDNGVKFKWSASKGADFYRIYYKNKESDGWTRLASKYLTEYTDTSVKDGATRIYTIRCLNENEDFVSDYVGKGFANTYFAPPAIDSVTAQEDGWLAEWEAREGVDAYRLYRKTLGGSWSRLFDAVPESSYLDTGVEEGKIYAYTLRYLDDEGELISGYTDNVKYYQDGEPVDGKIRYNDKTYFFDKGYLRSGLQRIDGKLYYYNENGSISKDAIVKSGSDYYYADKNGVCCESEEICLAAEFMAKNCKGDTLKEKMKSGFMYLADNFPYQRYYDPPKSASDMPRMATTCFKNRNANCYRYAAAFCCLARIAGYRARVAIGTTGGLPHGWTEVYVDGKWLICDPDANIPQYHMADYAAYMMKSHFWQLSKSFSAELTIENGKAVWK